MIRNDITIRPETPADFPVIDQLVRRTFAQHTGYSDGEGEVMLVHEIREKEFYLPQLSFVAELEGKIVGHFMFSRFPLSSTPKGGYNPAHCQLLMLAPVSVHADYVHQGIGETMLRLGIEQAKAYGAKGLSVEGDFHFYNRLGFVTSADYGIFATSGFPMEEPRCMMVQETAPGSLKDLGGYIVYDMYENA